jgi:hypothetical protein
MRRQRKDDAALNRKYSGGMDRLFVFLATLGIAFGAAAVTIDDADILLNSGKSLELAISEGDLAGGGSPVALDLDNDPNTAAESANITDIHVAGDPNNVIFSEPSDGELLIDASQNWPTCTLSTTATAFASDPNDCAAGEHANAIDASGNLSCDPNGGSGGGGSGSMTTVEEDNSQVGGADIVTLDFGNGLDVFESPDTEQNIVVDPNEVDHDALQNFTAGEHFGRATRSI